MDIATITGHYNYSLVTLSIVIAIFAAYAALDLAGRVTSSRGRIQLAWLAGGAFAMGMGIWAMHYAGMEALRLSVPVQYDWPDGTSTGRSPHFATGGQASGGARRDALQSYARYAHDPLEPCFHSCIATSGIFTITLREYASFAVALRH